MKSSKTSFLRNCISGWNVRTDYVKQLKEEFATLYLTLHERSQSLRTLYEATHYTPYNPAASPRLITHKL